MLLEKGCKVLKIYLRVLYKHNKVKINYKEIEVIEQLDSNFRLGIVLLRMGFYTRLL